MISYSWIYPIVRHSRRRFSNFAGGGRQRQRGGGMFSAPKNQHHKTVSPPVTSATSPEDGALDDRSSTCCFSNVSEKLFHLLSYDRILSYQHWANWALKQNLVASIVQTNGSLTHLTMFSESIKTWRRESWQRIQKIRNTCYQGMWRWTFAKVILPLLSTLNFTNFNLFVLILYTFF